MATFDDMAIEGKLTIYDKGLRRGRPRLRRVHHRAGDVYSPRISNAEPLRIECEHFVECVARARNRDRTVPAVSGWYACSRSCKKSLDSVLRGGGG